MPPLAATVMLPSFKPKQLILLWLLAVAMGWAHMAQVSFTCPVPPAAPFCTWRLAEPPPPPPGGNPKLGEVV